MDVSDLTWSEQNIITDIEDKYIDSELGTAAPKFSNMISYVSNPMSDSIKKVILFSSLPWSVQLEDSSNSNTPQYEQDAEILSEIWNIRNCTGCINSTNVKSLPFGNLHPKYVVIFNEDIGTNQSKYPRVLEQGEASRFIKRGFALADIYWDCWFTPLAKCVRNCTAVDDEILVCNQWLAKELYLLQCKNIIMLGNCQFPLDEKDFNIISVEDYSSFIKPKKFSGALRKAINAKSIG